MAIGEVRRAQDGRRRALFSASYNSCSGMRSLFQNHPLTMRNLATPFPEICSMVHLGCPSTCFEGPWPLIFDVTIVIDGASPPHTGGVPAPATPWIFETSRAGCCKYGAVGWISGILGVSTWGLRAVTGATAHATAVGEGASALRMHTGG